MDFTSAEPLTTDPVHTTGTFASAAPSVTNQRLGLQLCITPIGALTSRLKPSERIATARFAEKRATCESGTREKSIQREGPEEESKVDTEAVELDTLQSA
jgi:hypothetical protein